MRKEERWALCRVRLLCAAVERGSRLAKMLEELQGLDDKSEVATVRSEPCVVHAKDSALVEETIAN